VLSRENRTEWWRRSFILNLLVTYQLNYQLLSSDNSFVSVPLDLTVVNHSVMDISELGKHVPMIITHGIASTGVVLGRVYKTLQGSQVVYLAKAPFPYKHNPHRYWLKMSLLKTPPVLKEMHTA